MPSPHVVSLSWLLLQFLGLYYVLYVLFYYACMAYLPEALSLYSWTCIMYHTYYTVILYYLYSTYKYHVLRNPRCGRSAKHSIFMRPPSVHRRPFAIYSSYNAWYTQYFTLYFATKLHTRSAGLKWNSGFESSGFVGPIPLV